MAIYIQQGCMGNYTYREVAASSIYVYIEHKKFSFSLTETLVHAVSFLLQKCKKFSFSS